MQISLDTLKTTAFALKYRLRGYKLLQNPKGTHPNEVVMLKDWFGFNGDRYDKIYHYKRVHRKIEGNKAVVERKFLMTTHLMNPETKTYSGDKNIIYEINKNGKYSYYEKEDMSFENMESRKLPEWENRNAEYDFGKNLFNEQRNKNYYPKLSFWQILKSNLGGGEKV